MRDGLRRTILTIALLSMITGSTPSHAAERPHSPVTNFGIRVEGAAIQIDFEAGGLDLPRTAIVSRIQKAALAVATYYGGFPVSRARILVIPIAGEGGVLQGTTWGDVDGFPGFTRLRIGQHTTEAELESDWIMTHEMVHMALASLPDDQSWLEEGIATYVEPIARVQTGDLKVEKMWGDLVAGLPNGEPRANDRGMNQTHTWGRTYWGGALFCLLADIEIRKQTNNQKGLQAALQGIVASHGTIDKTWPPDRVMRAGDEATGKHVLEQMYAEWSRKPVTVDLDDLWTQLGVVRSGRNISFNPVAPLSRIRVMLTTSKGTAVFPVANPPSAVQQISLGP